MGKENFELTGLTGGVQETTLPGGENNAPTGNEAGQPSEKYLTETQVRALLKDHMASTQKYVDKSVDRASAQVKQALAQFEQSVAFMQKNGITLTEAQKAQMRQQTINDAIAGNEQGAGNHADGKSTGGGNNPPPTDQDTVRQEVAQQAYNTMVSVLGKDNILKEGDGWYELVDFETKDKDVFLKSVEIASKAKAKSIGTATNIDAPTPKPKGPTPPMAAGDKGKGDQYAGLNDFALISTALQQDFEKGKPRG